MNELSLFTGAGGGVLGSKILGHRIIGYVEYEPYCQEIIKQRIADGILDAAPIFGDIRSFNREYANAYRDMVDVLTGGFPCQPFSVAGKGLGESDPRNMWPQTLETIRIVRPRYAFLENVPGLLSKEYFGKIMAQIYQSGYDAKWCVLGADDVGANHRRKRLWILAYSQSHGTQGRICESWERRIEFREDGERRDVAYSKSAGAWKDDGRLWQRAGGVGRGKGTEEKDVADANEAGRRKHSGAEPIQEEQSAVERGSQNVAQPESEGSFEDYKTRAARKGHAVAMSYLETAVDYHEGQTGGTLNPAWVELLMGFPMDWTCIKPMNHIQYSKWLIGFMEALNEKKKEGISKAMQDLQKTNDSEGVWQILRRFRLLETAKILLPILRQYSEKLDETWLQFSSEETLKKELRSVWGNQKAKCPSYKSKNSRQLAGKHSDSLQMVSRLSPPYGTEAWEKGSWENGVDRLSSGIKDRVSRLKALGNAQVPLQMAYAFSILSQGIIE